MEGPQDGLRSGTSAFHCCALHYTSHSPSGPMSGPHSHANGATHAGPMADPAVTTRGSLRRENGVTVQGPGRKPMEDDPRSTGHSRSTGPDAHTTEATRTGPTVDPSRRRWPDALCGGKNG